MTATIGVGIGLIGLASGELNVGTVGGAIIGYTGAALGRNAHGRVGLHASWVPLALGAGAFAAGASWSALSQSDADRFGQRTLIGLGLAAPLAQLVVDGAALRQFRRTE